MTGVADGCARRGTGGGAADATTTCAPPCCDFGRLNCARDILLLITGVDGCSCFGEANGRYAAGPGDEGGGCGGIDNGEGFFFFAGALSTTPCLSVAGHPLPFPPTLPPGVIIFLDLGPLLPPPPPNLLIASSLDGRSILDPNVGVPHLELALSTISISLTPISTAAAETSLSSAAPAPEEDLPI